MKQKRNKKPRIIVRPWIPNKLPPEITADLLKETIEKIKPKIKSVLYAGWKRKRVNGKRVTQFVLSTGDTAKEARNNFKKSENFGEDVWIIERNDN